MCPPGEGGGVIPGGVHPDLLSKVKHHDRKACLLLFQLHKYLLEQPGVTVDQGFQFVDADHLMKFRHRFWSNSSERPDWMSTSFDAFKTQLGRCKFIHDDTVDKLTWRHPLFTKENPDFIGIINDKKGGSNTHSGTFVSPTSLDDDYVPDLSNNQLDLPSAVLDSLHEKVKAIQPVNKTMLSFKSTPMTVVNHLTCLEDALVFFEEGLNKLSRLIEIERPAVRLAQVIECLLTKGVQRWAPDLKKRCGKMVLESSSSLIGVPMGIDELRSTICGDTIGRMLEFCNVDVSQVNQLVDWGNPLLGALIEYFIETIPCWEVADKNPIGDMKAFFDAAKSKFDQDCVFQSKAMKAMTHYESGDEKYKQVWLKIREISLLNLNEIYSRLGVSPQEMASSLYSSLVPVVVDYLRTSGIVFEDVGGDWVIRDSVSDKHKTVVDEDGNYSISAIYLAALRYRLEEIEADWILYVCYAGRKKFFESIFSVARRVGWLPAAGTVKPEATHVGLRTAVYGDFDPSSGVVGLLDGVLCRCLQMLDEKAGKYNWSDEELKQIAETIGYGALKYANLRIDGEKRCEFSYDEILDAEGNTAVNLQFALARIRNITKCYKEIENLRMTGSVVLCEAEEYTLACHLARFTVVVEEACLTLKPHILCKYLERLSEHFTSFIAPCPVVVDSPEEISRVLLCEATEIVFHQCLLLLGVGSVLDIKETLLD